MYTDSHIAGDEALLGRIKVYLNGKEVKQCVAAEHGKNGFVEYCPLPLRVKNDEVFSVKKRGNVKISFNLWDRYGQ